MHYAHQAPDKMNSRAREMPEAFVIGDGAVPLTTDKE
jgi:hypothetical protein